ncbi:hypothetical protein SNOG_06389 [Parastagonospora nodorum SN15]|uniref:Cytochrome P450 n=1 Tax=Phaeosphaeria nodorum (strain SN15 / ATCC MYA-4574 / FGSC 10173) TaxID=321614 RepID=Q0UPC5_PHANO|nr:hypothetical protein SNOG_06389 [Parastagonospora nodorum SN15]EAT86220.2 hypothetical protein SNOG_06389 [Parastagonospora nodorum SN15]
MYTLGFTSAFLLAAGFNIGVLSSIAIYRLVFHRCRKFPGPFPAKLSKFYAASLSAKDVQFYKELANLHGQEISINRKEAVPLLYGPNSQCLKSTWYGQTGNDPQKCSIHMTRDFNGHRLRRRAWDKGFSIKALSSYEPRIKSKADLFKSQLAKAAGKPMDVSTWSMFFSFDVMGEVGFGKDFNNLNTGVEHSAIKGVHSHMTMLATTLASALFYLAKNPSTQKKLQAHLDRAMPGGYSDWSYEKVKSVSYVDDFINETLRLKPALLTGGARETPAKGIQVGDVYIPGNTNVMVPIWLIQRDERYWPEADKFVPERFGERREEMGTDKAPYLPFSLGKIPRIGGLRAFADIEIGAYACPGKNLAQLSLRTSLSMIAQNFDVAFAPGEDGVTFDNEMLDTFTVTLPPLQLQFTPRNAA